MVEWSVTMNTSVLTRVPWLLTKRLIVSDDGSDHQ
jgi:hypothetical protein